MLKVNNDALIVMCVASEGLLTDYKSKGSLAAIGDYRLSHKETIRDYESIKNYVYSYRGLC